MQNLANAIKERMKLDPISAIVSFACITEEEKTQTISKIAHNSGLYIDTPSSFATAVRVGNEMKYPLIEKCVEQFDGKREEGDCAFLKAY